MHGIYIIYIYRYIYLLTWFHFILYEGTVISIVDLTKDDGEVSAVDEIEECMDNLLKAGGWKSSRGEISYYYQVII